MSYEFRSLNMQSLAYDAATNLPPLVALSNGGQYVVGTQGSVATTTIAGAQAGVDAVLLVGDTVQSLSGAYSLVSASITVSQNVDVGIGGTALFASLLDAMTYLAQRTIDADVIITVNLLASYTGVEADSVIFAHPQASQIQVLGIASSQTISACTGVTGAIGDLAVSYTLNAPITGLAVGDVVIIDNETCTDPQTTLFLGSHCGTWLVSAVAGTAVTVQNIQRMRVTLTNAGFAGARMTKVTKVAEQGNFSNVVRMTVGNLAFHHDLNKYVMVGVNGSILINGFLGAGSTSASANTTQVVLTEEFDVLSAAYQAINVAGTTYTMGLNSFFAPNGGKSAIQVASGQGAIVIGKDIDVETLICGTAFLDADQQSMITAKNKFGAYYSEGGNAFFFTDAACNVSGLANTTTDGSMFILTQTACNSNTNGNFTTSGSVTIITQTACNSNTSTGNFNGGTGNFYIGTQTNCSNNASSNNVCASGNMYIGTQTACTGASYGNRILQNGLLTINSQVSCTGNSTADNLSFTGKLLIAGGTSVTTGTVSMPNGGGSVVKSGGTSPFTVTDAPVPVSYALSATLTNLNYFSIATANSVAFTLPLVSTVQQDVIYTVENGGAYTGVNVRANAADTGGIGGVTTFITLPPYGYIQLITTAALTWTVVASSSNILGGSTSSLVGYQAGILATAASNQLIGYNAGSAVTTGASNTYLGAYTGSSSSDSTSSNNVILSDGDGNVTLRANGLSANTLPVAVGVGAATLVTTGASVTAVGTNALSRLTTNGLSTAVGYQAGQLATGTGNQLFGYNAGSALSQSIATLGAIAQGTLYTNGTYNNVIMSLVSGTAMTVYPMVNITVSAAKVTACVLVRRGMGGDTTTVLTVTSAQIGGTGSGFFVPVATTTVCANNTIIGAYTGSSLATPSNNVILSDGIGNVVFNVGGTNNIASGYQALKSNATGTNNTANGANALAANISGSNNTASGYQALAANTVSNNTANGYQALAANTTGLNNTANGYQALAANTTGNNNTANGYQALAVSTGSSSTAYGFFALLSNTTGENNTAIGSQALAANTTTSNTTAIGYSALQNNTTGANNTATGYNALKSNATGANNTANGYQALAANTTGTNNTANGANALAASTGTNNTAIGSQALAANTFSGNNTACGANALAANDGGTFNTAIGSQSLAANTTSSFNTAIGYQSLAANITGANNTANGYRALAANLASNNTANGYQVLVANITGSSNTASGYQALAANTAGSANTADGYQALAANITGSNNTASGYMALAVNLGANNTANGYQALAANTTGSANTADGYQALLNNTNGARNIAIGYQAAATLSAIATLGVITGGTLYTNGTYNNVTMSLVSGTAMVVYPIVNITVAGGVVTTCVFVTRGVGGDTTTILTVTTAQIGGTGSGFSVPVATIGSPTDSTYIGGYKCTNTSDATLAGNVILSDGSGNIVFRANGPGQTYNANTTWTPADGSGASLVFTVGNATYSTMSNQVTFTTTLTYPITANASNAIISGLPRFAKQTVLVQAFSLGLPLVGVVNGNSQLITLYDAATNQAVTNTTLSGKTIIISGTYST